MLGMFVKTTRRRRGDKVYEYLSLVESVRNGSKVGHRTLLRLGEVTALRESGQLERIVAALERHLRRERVDVEPPRVCRRVFYLTPASGAGVCSRW